MGIGKIGITERGDAARDLSWVQTLERPEYSGAIVITKTITTDFAHAVLSAKKPVIVHCTCTGYGGTEMEPNVFDYRTQLNSLKHLIDAGFPKHRAVLRLDPIIPTDKGIQTAWAVLQYFSQLNTGVSRIRFSILDEYQHVKKRFMDKGWGTVYPGNNFQPSVEQMDKVLAMLEAFKMPKCFFESCAENGLWARAKQINKQYLFEPVGCVSYEDLFLMGFEGFSKNTSVNPQKRTGCMCLSYKSEMLGCKHQCTNGCTYCYWR